MAAIRGLRVKYTLQLVDTLQGAIALQLLNVTHNFKPILVVNLHHDYLPGRHPAASNRRYIHKVSHHHSDTLSVLVIEHELSELLGLLRAFGSVAKEGI